jgi:hypothetical protein
MTDNQPPRRILAPPKASAMIEALRGLGYSTSSALADIIDNSIAAEASKVDIEFVWAGQSSYLTIVDDGRGMTEKDLERAMRLGDRSPLAARAPGDLGRFGLGLKTASFSQCRRLTVASRQASSVSCLRWDLDAIAATGGAEWELLEGTAPGSEHLLTLLSPERTGTLVVWEVMDRIITSGFREQDILDLIDRVERHLAMVFHRYIEGEQPRVSIMLNGRLVAPWDPFLIDHRDTWSSPEERIPSSAGAITVQAHVLPHKDRLDARAYAAGGGLDGWTTQQGFYVYRQNRLLIGGTWLGLGRGRAWTKEEAHRLARIRIEIGFNADEAWKIDIRKSTARPPVEVRTRLTALAEDARERARRVFAWRGRVIARRTGQPVVQAWNAQHTANGVRYRIDESHHAVAAVLHQAGEMTPLIRAMLRVIEETVPVQRIWLDTAEAKDAPRTGFTASPSSEVRQVLQVMYRNLVRRRGLSPAEARERLLLSEPFDGYPELVASLPDDPSNEA